jgi:uncharacterized lipoprotein YbaY
MTANRVWAAAPALCLLLAFATTPQPQAFSQDPRYLPPPGSAGFQLGVRVANRDVGAQITGVLPGSAAARAGLERNDLVVNVQGQQVGYVNGRLNDLGDACSRLADPQGRVTLLVRNNRTGQLLNVPAQLAPAGGGGGGTAVNGNLFCPAGAPLDPSSTFTVRIVELPRWNAPPVTVAEISFPAQGRNPTPYLLGFNPQDFPPGRQYVLEAELSRGGQRLYRARTAFSPTPGVPVTTVDLTLAPEGGGGPRPPASVQQIRAWFLTYLGREPDQAGFAFWQSQVARGLMTLEEVQANILASSEFFDRCSNDPQVFVAELYRVVLSRQASPAEVQAWLVRLQANGGNRLAMVREFLQAARREK